MSNPLATAAQLEAAFTIVLNAEIKEELNKLQTVCKSKTTPALQQEPWKTLLINAFNVEYNRITADLNSRIGAAAKACVVELNTSTPQHGTKANDTTDPELSSLTNANHVYFFGVAVYTKFWTDVAAKAGPSLEETFGTLAMKATKFCESVVLLYNDLSKELLTLTKRVDDVHAAAVAILSDPTLKKYFLTVADDTITQRDAAIGLIKSNDTSVLRTRLADLAKSRPLAELDFTELSNVEYFMAQEVIYETIALTEQLQRIEIQRLQALKAFLKDYGASAAYSLIPLPDINVRAFLDLYAGGSFVSFTMDFKSNIPAATHFSVVALCVSAGAAFICDGPGGYNSANMTPEKRKAAAAIAVAPVSNRINLQQNVTVIGWRAVGPIMYPIGFSTGQFSTDLACLKHVKHETGNAPTKEKLSAYFAEIVLACTAAKNVGVGSYKGRPVNGRASWNIEVKTGTDGKPEIFHVDSGYRKSPWFDLVL